ncbi:uncharacterized protein IAS62_004032 [Cryptococcus decagattii]|uniref:TauD/TfdA-like domain-containing protein n=1 Tax=Cryptococcus decagattii TaxID=1859122 RepID=A0ABZ2AZ96_9TREE
MPQEIQQREQGVLEVLNKVHRFGFCFITGVPVDAKETETLIKAIGPIRHTHYGGFWSFTADLSHGDLAYSTQSLPAHTDTTYFTDPAGLQTAFTQLHDFQPLILPHILFFLDSLFQLTPQVRWNNEDRGIIGHGWSAAEVRQWYQAAQRFESLIKSKEVEYWVQLNPGTMLIIDNWRVMHGRSAFTGSRTMCGAYIGADDWHSRRAVLTERHGNAGGTDDIWRFGW